MKNKIMIIFENVGLVDENNREIILFGLSKIFDTLLSWLFTIICAWLMGDFLVGIIFETCYMILRQYAGGYHTKSKRSCLILTYLSTFVCLCVVFTVPCDSVLIVLITLLSDIIIIRYAPIQSDNKPLNAMERKVYRKKTVCIIFYLTILICIMLLSKHIIYAETIVVSLILVMVGIVASLHGRI